MNLVSGVVLGKVGEQLTDLLKRLDEERTSYDLLNDLTNEFSQLRASAYKATPVSLRQEFDDVSGLDIEDDTTHADIRKKLRAAIVATRDWIVNAVEL
jgi:hypothetical protein